MPIRFKNKIDLKIIIKINNKIFIIKKIPTTMETQTHNNLLQDNITNASSSSFNHSDGLTYPDSADKFEQKDIYYTYRNQDGTLIITEDKNLIPDGIDYESLDKNEPGGENIFFTCKLNCGGVYITGDKNNIPKGSKFEIKIVDREYFNKLWREHNKAVIVNQIKSTVLDVVSNVFFGLILIGVGRKMLGSSK